MNLDGAGAVVVRPGDRVLLMLQRDVTREMADRIKAELATRFPDVEFVIAGAVRGALVMPRTEEES